MAGHARLMDSRLLDDIAHGRFAVEKRLDDTASGRVGERLEGVCLHDYIYTLERIYCQGVGGAATVGAPPRRR
jgi:hypothetical protein